MNTLAEQLNLAQHHRIHKFNDAHFEWLIQFESQFTHAITLTFNEHRIAQFNKRIKSLKVFEGQSLIELQRKSLTCFRRKLNKSLFGAVAQRYENKLLLIPMSHGLYTGGRLHYHCAIGIPEDRFEAIDMKVRAAWKAAPLSGHHIDIKPYRSSEWLGYMNRETKYINRECIDWSNVCVPSVPGQFPTTAE